MTWVQTAAGQVNSSQLGFTLMHEHVFLLTPELDSDYPEFVLWDEEQRVTEAAATLRMAKANGVETIVDLTVLGMGRSVERVARVSRLSGVNIIVASGLYTFDELPRFLARVGPGATIERSDPMVEMFVKDVKLGIGQTGIRAGVLKCATDTPGVTPNVARVLRAVAQTQRETGIPISTHAHAGLRRGLEQLDIFDAEGVDLSRVVVGHCGDSVDLSYLRAVADRGAYLGMDRFGMDRPPHITFEERVSTVAEMCRLGYAAQLVLSHDVACWSDWLPGELRRGSGADYPNWRFTHITDDVIPALIESGVSEADVNLMMFDNPRRIFSGA